MCIKWESCKDCCQSKLLNEGEKPYTYNVADMHFSPYDLPSTGFL